MEPATHLGILVTGPLMCMHGLRLGEFKDLACLNFLIGNFDKPLKNLRMQGLRIN